MQDKQESGQERLARLEKELAELKAALPEHCHGEDGYISDHRASPDLWDKIEQVEEEIKALKAESGG